jgi:3'-phosphoadenosine 5'-phosphosulfate sulfotransferase (PAPS reductase)/FAD synthetase
MNTSTPQEILDLIARGALFVANNSGGKDSQAMLLFLKALVPAAQLMVIHAELPGVEWQGTLEHARDISAGLPFVTVRATKTFMEMVDSRQNWPSPQYRQCTSDLKRGPIEKAIRHWIKEHALSGLVVNCMGLRAQESCIRAKATPFKKNERNSKAGREWYDWLPIFTWTKDDVILSVKKAGQQLHWAYAHVSRLSCVFCIMGNRADLTAAAQLNPELYAAYVAKEKEIGKTLFAKTTGKGEDKKLIQLPLEEITGVPARKA